MSPTVSRSTPVAFCALIGAVLLGGSLVPMAHAVSVGLQGDRLIVRAAPGERNTLSISIPSGGAVVVEDEAAFFGGYRVGPGCEEDQLISDPSPPFVTCFPPASGIIEVHTGDRDDSVRVTGAGSLRLVISGEGGNDSLSGGRAADLVMGGDDNDRLAGQGGDDQLDGGSGDDLLDGGDGNDALAGGADVDEMDGGPGSDAIDGGAGWDIVSYAGRTDPVTVRQDDRIGDGAAGEADNVLVSNEKVVGGAGDDVLEAPQNPLRSSPGSTLVGGPGADAMTGGAGPDNLLGDAGRDRLRGRRGADLVVGGADADAMTGGPHADILAASDRLADTVACGSGTDTALHDRRDRLDRTCEGLSARRASPGGAGIGGGVAARAQGKLKPSRGRQRSIHVRVVTDPRITRKLRVRVTMVGRRGRIDRVTGSVRANRWKRLRGVRVPRAVRRLRAKVVV